MIVVEDIDVDNTYINSIYARDTSTFTKNTFVGNDYVETFCINNKTLISSNSCICGSINDLCKFTILSLRFGVLRNCYLYLQIFLDKILYYAFIQLICLRVYLLFHLILKTFSIAVI